MKADEGMLATRSGALSFFKDLLTLSFSKYLQSKHLFQKVSFRKDTLQKIFEFHWWNRSSRSGHTHTDPEIIWKHALTKTEQPPLITIYALGSISINFRCFAHKPDWNQTVNICFSFSALTHWLHDFMCLQLKLHLIWHWSTSESADLPSII